ncbi:hypothetical protein BREVUG8_110019 [Brevundimonas sp. G8]|nr:hypothetical protein BREVUG8_110019 [Brevundimonas sp. G8]
MFGSLAQYAMQMHNECRAAFGGEMSEDFDVDPT